MKEWAELLCKLFLIYMAIACASALSFFVIFQFWRTLQ